MTVQLNTLHSFQLTLPKGTRRAAKYVKLKALVGPFTWVAGSASHPMDNRLSAEHRFGRKGQTAQRFTGEGFEGVLFLTGEDRGLVHVWGKVETPKRKGRKAPAKPKLQAQPRATPNPGLQARVDALERRVSDHEMRLRFLEASREVSRQPSLFDAA